MVEHGSHHARGQLAHMELSQRVKERLQLWLVLLDDTI
jgi:hypothetical protein